MSASDTTAEPIDAGVLTAAVYQLAAAAPHVARALELASAAAAATALTARDTTGAGGPAFEVTAAFADAASATRFRAAMDDMFIDPTAFPPSLFDAPA